MNNVSKTLMPRTWRAKTTQNAYQAERALKAGLEYCPLCDNRKPIETFVNWKIVPNKFPYDAVAETHHLIITTTHKTEAEITPEEWAELHTLKHAYLNKNYVIMAEALPSAKSVPGHFHLHLLVPKIID